MGDSGASRDEDDSVEVVEVCWSSIWSFKVAVERSVDGVLQVVDKTTGETSLALDDEDSVAGLVLAVGHGCWVLLVAKGSDLRHGNVCVLTSRPAEKRTIDGKSDDVLGHKLDGACRVLSALGAEGHEPGLVDDEQAAPTDKAVKTPKEEANPAPLAHSRPVEVGAGNEDDTHEDVGDEESLVEPATGELERRKPHDKTGHRSKHPGEEDLGARSVVAESLVEPAEGVKPSREDTDTASSAVKIVELLVANASDEGDDVITRGETDNEGDLVEGNDTHGVGVVELALPVTSPESETKTDTSVCCGPPPLCNGGAAKEVCRDNADVGNIGYGSMRSINSTLEARNGSASRSWGRCLSSLASSGDLTADVPSLDKGVGVDDEAGKDDTSDYVPGVVTGSVDDLLLGRLVLALVGIWRPLVGLPSTTSTAGSALAASLTALAPSGSGGGLGDSTFDGLANCTSDVCSGGSGTTSAASALLLPCKEKVNLMSAQVELKRLGLSLTGDSCSPQRPPSTLSDSYSQHSSESQLYQISGHPRSRAAAFI